MTYSCGLCSNNCKFTREEMIENFLLDEEDDYILDCFCPYMREYTEFKKDEGEEDEEEE